MFRVNKRVGGILVVILYLVFGLFVFVTVYYNERQFVNTGASVEKYKGSLVLTQEEIQKNFGEGVSYPEKLTYLDDVLAMQAKQATISTMPLLIVFFIVSAIFFYCIWRISKGVYLTQLNTVVSQATKDYDYKESADFEELIIKMKKQLEISTNDYRRLNAYLAHEQKNTISILRSRMEMDDNRMYLSKLDAISNSIDDLLTLSEATMGEQKNYTELAIVCAKAIDMYSQSATIYFDFDELLNTTIYGTERWLYRAICNLLDNAIKYGKCNPIRVKIAQENQSIILSVEDQGVGIASKELTKIFDNRYRISSLNTDGYGIGLSLVKHVCTLCHGALWVSSKVGKGSTFYLSFPVIRN